MTLDLKDFYLCGDLPDYKYVRITMNMLPSAIITLYNLEPKISNGYVYAEVRKGMYELPQAGKLANNGLHKFLDPFGYVPCPVTPGLWKHLHRDLMFTLIDDHFGIQNTDKKDHHQQGMDWHPIHRSYPPMELQSMLRQSFHARVHCTCPATIHAS
jgi:hypothetical protein